MQIDQDPSDYRMQRPGGHWVNRVDRKLARWLAAISTAFMAFLGWCFVAEGGNGDIPLVFWMMGFFAGIAIALSFRSID